MVVLVNTHSAIASTPHFPHWWWRWSPSSGRRRIGGGLRAVLPRTWPHTGRYFAVLRAPLVAEFRLSQSLRFPDQEHGLRLRGIPSSSPVSAPIVDGSYRWFAVNSHKPSVQIDYALWGTGSPSRSRYISDPLGPDEAKPGLVVRGGERSAVLAFLVGSLSSTCLQLGLSLFVYRIIPPLQVTNFPWRMLAFVTPIAL